MFHRGARLEPAGDTARVCCRTSSRWRSSCLRAKAALALQDGPVVPVPDRDPGPPEERCTMTSPCHILCEATIEDPPTFSEFWTIRLLLYRHVDPNARIGSSSACNSFKN